MSALSQNPESSHDELVALRWTGQPTEDLFAAMSVNRPWHWLGRSCRKRGLPGSGERDRAARRNWLAADVPMAGDGYRALLRGFDLYVRAATGKYLQSVDPGTPARAVSSFCRRRHWATLFLYTLTAPLKGRVLRTIRRSIVILAFHIAAHRQRYRRLVPKNCRAGRMSGPPVCVRSSDGEVIDCDVVVIGSGAGGAVAAL